MTDTYIIDLLYQDQAKGQEAVKQVYLEHCPSNIPLSLVRAVVFISLWDEDFKGLGNNFFDPYDIYPEDDDISPVDKEELDHFYASFSEVENCYSDRVDTLVSIMRIEKLTEKEKRAFEMLNRVQHRPTYSFGILDDFYEYIEFHGLDLREYNPCLEGINEDLNKLTAYADEQLKNKTLNYDKEGLDKCIAYMQ